MNRTKFPMTSLDREIVTLHGRIVIGATGAIPAVGNSNNCRGFSVARTGVGAYTITLADKFKKAVTAKSGITTPPDVNALIDFEDSTGGGGGAAGALLLACVKAAAVDPSGTITFTCLLASSSAAGDPASGTIMKITLWMRSTITPPTGI